MNICKRIQWERGEGIFSIEEPNGKYLDVERTFAPNPKLWTRSIRFVFIAFTLFTLILNLIFYPKENLWIYMGYLTHWALVLALMYLISSLFCSVFPSLVKQPSSPSSSIRKASSSSLTITTPRFFVKWTWMLFSLTCNLQILIILLYWTNVYEPGEEDNIEFLNLMKHGIVGIFVFIDGFFVGNIPIRIKHIYFIWGISTLYLLWTAIHAWYRLGNGDWNSEIPNNYDATYNNDDNNNNDDDDALYIPLNWNKRPTMATIASSLTMFLLIPLIFFITWFLSLCTVRLYTDGSHRRLYSATIRRGQKAKTTTTTTTKDEETGNSGTWNVFYSME